MINFFTVLFLKPVFHIECLSAVRLRDNRDWTRVVDLCRMSVLVVKVLRFNKCGYDH